MRSGSKNIRKLVAFLIMVSTIFTVFVGNPKQVKAATANVEARCSFNDSANILNLISRINTDRTSGGAFYVKNGVNVPVLSGSLMHGNKLQRIAETRAAELMVKESYTRPNGKAFNTLEYIGMTSDFERYFTSDKLLTGQELYNKWFNWGKAESAEFLMSDFYKTIGVACLELKAGSKYFYVLELSSKSEPSTAQITDSDRVISVEYDPNIVGVTYKMTNPVIGGIAYHVGSRIWAWPQLVSYRGLVIDEYLTWPSNPNSSKITYKVVSLDNNIVVDSTDPTTYYPKKKGLLKFRIDFYYDGSRFYSEESSVNVEACDISDGDISCTLNSPWVDYTGSAVVPSVAVVVRGASSIKFVEGVDYKIVNPKNNVNVSTENSKASIEIQGMGNLTGTIRLEYEIRHVNLPKPTVIGTTDLVYNGSEQYPTVKLTFNGKTLVEGKDYEISPLYSKGINVGLHSILVSGIGNFYSSREVGFNILPYTVKESQVGSISDQVYTGKGIWPDAKVVVNNKTLAINKDYTVEYSNVLGVGPASATFTFKGNYTSEKPIVRNYQIVSPTPTATPSPTATPKPTATATPKPTAIATPTTAVTVKPTVTPTATPVVTAKPTSTVAPTVTSKPTATPVVTEKPVVTTEPKPTATATPSEAVKPTATPVVTAKPVVTAEPKPTATAIPSEAVKPTATPVVTVKPVVTAEPKPTATAIPSEAVKPTATPVVTAKPVVTTEPEPTSTVAPSATSKPVAKPTSKPSVAPTTEPSNPTVVPTTKPSIVSTTVPTSVTTVTPSKEPVVETTKAPSVEDFAERLYTTCLGREAEQAGKEYWTSELKAGKPGSEVAEGFFFSPEFVGFNLDNEEYITRLYRTFMGREPDKDGIDYWSSEMDNGKDRKFVFDGFVNSPEWADICLTYGIRSGGLASPTFEKQASAKVIAFAERLYTTCLGRAAEKEGLEWWSAELANLRQTGTVAASGFFYSPEFIGLKTSDDEYVTRLYRTFMGREPEEAGFKFWTDELKAGKDRQYVFDGFSVAPEFANLCAEAGIMR